MLVNIGEPSRAVARGGENLCLSCRFRFARTYAHTNRTESLCLRLDQPQALRGPVARCTDHISTNHPTKYEMDKIA